MPDEVPLVIDEIPGARGAGGDDARGADFTVRGAGELRVKESDRISALAARVPRDGRRVEEYDDGFTLEARPLDGGAVDAAGDHRLAMAFAIAATRAPARRRSAARRRSTSRIPGFFDELARLTR